MKDSLVYVADSQIHAKGFSPENISVQGRSSVSSMVSLHQLMVSMYSGWTMKMDSTLGVISDTSIIVMNLMRYISTHSKYVR